MISVDLTKSPEVIYKYPGLYTSRHSGSVWLLSDSRSGIRLTSGTCKVKLKLGEIANDIEIENFIPYLGAVTIENRF